MAMDMMGQGQDETVGGRGTSPSRGRPWPSPGRTVSTASRGPTTRRGCLLEDHDAHGWLACSLARRSPRAAPGHRHQALGIFAPCGDLHLAEMDGGDAGMSMGPDAELFTNLRLLMDGALEGSFTGKLGLP